MISNRWCKRENVEPDALKEWKINFFLKLLIIVFHFTLVIHTFYPLNLNLMNYVLVLTDKAAKRCSCLTIVLYQYS